MVRAERWSQFPCLKTEEVQTGEPKAGSQVRVRAGVRA